VLDAKLWDLFAEGRWIGMAEGQTAQEAIRMAKACLPDCKKQLKVKEWVPDARR
jgi:hypothetical protein